MLDNRNAFCALVLGASRKGNPNLLIIISPAVIALDFQIHQFSTRILYYKQHHNAARQRLRGAIG